MFRVLVLAQVVVNIAFLPFTAPQNKVAVLVRGESFRQHSHQGSRETGPLGFEPQKEAVRSHLEQLFLPFIFDMNYSAIDLFLDTPTTNFTSSLMSWYGPFINQSRHSHPGSISEHLNYILEHRDQYAGLFLTRPDIIFKNIFACALTKSNRNQILFSFREWLGTNGDTLQNGAHRVADLITWIPRDLFDDAHPCLSMNHETRGCLRSKYGEAWEIGNSGYILPGEQHDSDPEKDWNPLYKLAGRQEGNDVSSVRTNWTC